MAHKQKVFTITGATPDSATTAAVGNVAHGIAPFDDITISATIVGSTNGAVDACLQYKTDPDTDEWWDWIRFPQVGSGVTAKYSTRVAGGAAAVTVVGSCSTATPTIVLAANTNTGVRPTNAVRLVATTGVGTDSAATQTVRIFGRQRAL